MEDEDQDNEEKITMVSKEREVISFWTSIDFRKAKKQAKASQEPTKTTKKIQEKFI